MALDEYSVVAVAIQKMDTKLEKLAEDVFDVRVILGKQEVILEKITNLELSQTENNKRIHHRIDEVENKVNSMNEFHFEEGCPVHQKFVAKRDEYVRHIETRANNFEERLKVIEGKGTKRWELFVGEIIKFTVVIVAGLIALKLGVKV